MGRSHRSQKAGETFSQLLEEMIEREKMALLIDHLKAIADEGYFVELPPLSRRLLIERRSLKYLSKLLEKSQQLIKERCRSLSDDRTQAGEAIRSFCISITSSIDCMSADHSQSFQ